MLLQLLEANLRLVIDEKTKKTGAVRGNYQTWWLVLVDTISFALGGDELERELWADRVVAASGWDRVVLLHPTTAERAFDLRLVTPA